MFSYCIILFLVGVDKWVSKYHTSIHYRYEKLQVVYTKMCLIKYKKMIINYVYDHIQISHTIILSTLYQYQNKITTSLKSHYLLVIFINFLTRDKYLKAKYNIISAHCNRCKNIDFIVTKYHVFSSKSIRVKIIWGPNFFYIPRD